MLLLTVGLILVGFVLLVIGLFADIYALVYAAIGCAMAAGLVLLVYSRLSRTAAPAQAGGSAPAQGGGSAPAQGWGPPPPRSEPASSWTPPPPRSEPEPAPTWAPPPRPSAPTAVIDAVPSSDGPDTEVVPVGADAAVSGDGYEDGDFPIADYDELRVSEILPLIPELDLDELEVVRERELAGKRRSAVIDRIDDQMDELEGEVAPVAAPPVTAAPVTDGFPVPDYESRSVEEILALIPDLSDDELDMLAEREEQGQNRAAVLDAIDDQFEEVEVGDEELVTAMPVPVEPAPVQKVPAKKVPAKKVSAKKVPAKKVSAKKIPAKKVSAKRAPVKKAIADTVPAEKVPAKKLGVKKGPAKKVAVKAVKSPATKKVAVVAKVPAKKVVVAKKAPARKAVVAKAVKAVKAVKKVGRPAKKR